MDFANLLQSTSTKLSKASVTPADPAFPCSIESLITSVVSSTNQSYESAYQKIYQIWTSAISTLNNTDNIETTMDAATTTYLHALLVAMSSLNNGTASTGEHLLTTVLVPILNTNSNNSIYSATLIPTCLTIIADACTCYTSQLELFCAATLRHYSQEIQSMNTANEEKDELENINKSNSWRNWSTSLLRVCDAIHASESTNAINLLHPFLCKQLLPQLCRCALNVDNKHARVGALRIFGSPTVRLLFLQEQKEMNKLYQTCVVLWEKNDTMKQTKRIAYDVLVHTFELCQGAHLQEEMWNIVLEGLETDRDETIQKISLHLLHLACQRVYEDERWNVTSKDTTSIGTKNATDNQVDQQKQKQNMLKRQRWGRRMEQFRALYSVLDEFAHHLVDSMWPEMKSLYVLQDENTNSNTTNDSTNVAIAFPPSFMVPTFRWTSIILRKAFKHDNPSVRANLIRQFLEFPFSKNVHCPIAPSFLCDVLLPALDWPMFYRRHVEGIQLTLIVFFKRVLRLAGNQHQVGIYLRAYIEGLTRVINPYALSCLLQVFVSLRDDDTKDTKGTKGTKGTKDTQDNTQETKDAEGNKEKDPILLSTLCAGAFGRNELKCLRIIVSKNIDMNMSEHLVANGVVAAMTLCVDLNDLEKKRIQSIHERETATSDTRKIGESDAFVVVPSLSNSNLSIIGEILGRFRPPMLCPGTFRHLSISTWLNGHEWVSNELHDMLKSMLRSPRSKNYNANNYCSSNEFGLFWWCLSSSSADSILTTLCLTLGSLYKNAYMESGIVETALEIYVHIVRYRRLAMLHGAEGPKSVMSLSLEKDKADNTADTEDTTETEATEETKQDVYVRDICRIRKLFATAMNDMLSYCEMKCHSVEEAIFSHDGTLPLPLLAVRETALLYLAPFKASSFSSSSNVYNSSLNCVHSSLHRVLVQSISNLNNNTTADMEVVAMRNVDALLDVAIRSVLFVDHANEGWLPQNVLHMLLLHDRAYLNKMKTNRSTDTKMSMLLSVHVVHRWKCISWVLEALDMNAMAETDVVALFKGAADIMDCVGIECLPSVYSTLRRVLPKYIEIQQKKEQKKEQIKEQEENQEGQNENNVLLQEMTQLMNNAWSCLVDFELTKDTSHYHRMEEYLKFAFHSIMFRHFPTLTEKWFLIVMKHRNMTNPQLLQRLVMTCYDGCWSTQFDIAQQYVPYVCNSLILYQEPQTNHLHETERVHYGPPPTSLVRVISIWCLERMVKLDNTKIERKEDPIISSARALYLHTILSNLMDMNFQTDWIEDYMPTSRVHRSKMRCWQALCVLSKFIVKDSQNENKKFQEYVEKTSQIVLQNNHATIRYYVELFLARLLTGGGSKHIRLHLNSFILHPLRVVEVSTKSIASMLVVLIHSLNDIIIAIEENEENEEGEEDVRKDKKDSMKTQLVATVLPLLGSSGSQTRILSQIIMNRIHPKGYQNDTSTNQDAVHTVLSPILKFLRENKDMVRMRIKQEKVFSTEIIDYKCSMEGLLATPMNSFGDFYDVPLIERVRDACIEYQRETEILHPERFFFRNPKDKNSKSMKDKKNNSNNSNNKQSQPTKIVTDLVASAKSVEETEDHSAAFNFQQKIQPWSSLNVLNEEQANVRSGDVSEDKKSVQSLVVIASLLDKIPNLGGLARTAEIFGASKLVIGSKKVLENKLFQSVSVTAEKWIDIDECPPEELYAYLENMQQSGYSIIGVEQTSQSTSLEKYTFPTKTVLLLGREKTGIPSQFIHMLDHCVEIPQLGLIRSLNVHVSAAIMVWEYTRQQILKDGGD